MRHGRPAHHQAAERFAVPRHRMAGIVLDLHLDPERRMALFLLDIEPLLAGERGIFRLERAQGAERRHLGHPPGVDHLDAVVVLEFLSMMARGQAEPPITTRWRSGKPAAVRVEMLQQHQPDGRHRGRAGDPVLRQQFVRSTAPSSFMPGITRLAPAIGAENASDQPLA